MTSVPSQAGVPRGPAPPWVAEVLPVSPVIVFHRILPVLASRASIIPSPIVKTLLPTTETLDMPSPTPVVFQASAGPPFGHSFSRPVSVETPSRCGPRNWPQSGTTEGSFFADCAVTRGTEPTSAARRTTKPNFAVFTIPFSKLRVRNYLVDFLFGLQIVAGQRVPIPDIELLSKDDRMSPPLLAADPFGVEAADLFVFLGRCLHERDGSLLVPDD